MGLDEIWVYSTYCYLEQEEMVSISNLEDREQ